MFNAVKSTAKEAGRGTLEMDFFQKRGRRAGKKQRKSLEFFFLFFLVFVLFFCEF